MSNKEIEAYLKTIEEGFIESERILLKEKAAKNEPVINCDKTGILLAFQQKTYCQTPSVSIKDYYHPIKEGVVKMYTSSFLCTKPRLSQARALLFPKVFVPLGIQKISL